MSARHERAPAVVAHLPRPRRRTVVVGRDGAALAGRDDLPRVEAEAAGDAEPAAGAAAVARAERAGGVLEQRQPRAARAAGSGRPKRCTPSTAFVRGPTSILRRVDVHRLRVDVDEHGLQPGERDDVRGRREGVGGDEHLVARLEPEREHGEVQRRGARGDGERVLDLAGARELRLELGDLRAHREHAALEDLARPRRARARPTSGHA